MVVLRGGDDGLMGGVDGSAGCRGRGRRARGRGRGRLTHGVQLAGGRGDCGAACWAGSARGRWPLRGVSEWAAREETDWLTRGGAGPRGAGLCARVSWAGKGERKKRRRAGVSGLSHLGWVWVGVGKMGGSRAGLLGLDFSIFLLFSNSSS